MKMEERSVNKGLYKLEIVLLKTLPVGMMICSVANTILGYLGMETAILSFMGGLSILTALFLYTSSYVFRFCPYHRIPIHYCVISDCIAYYDMYIGIPTSDLMYLGIHLTIFGIAIILYLYLKFKVCKKH